MPLFEIKNQKLTQAKSINFKLEKELQTIIEQNLDIVFNSKFIASEFSTGAEHAGRIDTLALSEDNNPVIIEYKKVESSELINQSLYYLSWIRDHKGDFQIAVNKTLGKEIEIDWNDIRVICIAPGYKKYDLHAVQMMGANIELWQYRLYDNRNIYLEEVFKRRTVLPNLTTIEQNKNPIMVEAGKKAALTRLTGQYTFDEHLDGIDNNIKTWILELREFILNIDESIEESPKKYYIAYKITQNFVCIEIKKNKVTLYLKLNPKSISIPENGRDVTSLGHQGTGDFELNISNENQLEEAKKLIKEAYNNIG
jgi:predicted transport protein